MRTVPLLLLVALAGCASPEAGPPTAEEWSALAALGAVWVDARPDGLDEARDAVVDAVAAEPLVLEHALGDNGFGDAVLFASGALSGVVVRDDFGGVTPEQAERVDAWLAWVEEQEGADVVLAAPPVEPALKPPPVGTRSPASHEVLFVSAASAQAAGSDLSSFDLFREQMIERYCFEEGDFTLRSNRPEDGFGTLTPEDLTDLGGYGVVFVNAQGVVRPGLRDPLGLGYGLEPELFLQLSALDDREDAAGFGAEELAALYGSFDAQVWEVPRDYPSDETDPTLFVSADWWTEQVELDEGALVVLNVPGGFEAAEGLLDQGAGGVMGYGADQKVFPSASELFWGVSAMADFDVDLETSVDGSVTWPCDLPLTFSWLVEPDQSEFTCRLGSRPRVVGEGLSFPTWMDVGTVANPPGTTSVRTTVAYTDGSLPAPSPDVLEDVPGSPNTFEGLVPGAEVVVTSEALDAEGNVLGTATETRTLEPGGCNDLTLRFGALLNILLDGAARPYTGGVPPLGEQMHKFCATLTVSRDGVTRMDWSTANEAFAYFPDANYESGDSVRVVVNPIPACANPEADPPYDAPFMSAIYLHVWRGEDYSDQVTVNVSGGGVSVDQTLVVEIAED